MIHYPKIKEEENTTMKKKLIAAALIFTFALSALTGCGNDASKSASAEGTAANATEAGTKEQASTGNKAETEVKKVKVGAGNSYKPYCFIDENNAHAGFDVELLKAIDEYLKDYEFDIEASTINDLLAGLDAGNYALISHVLTKTPEREEKYLFGNENTGYKNFWFLAKKDVDISSFEDLAGKTFLDKPGKGLYSYIEKYNEEHPDAKIILEGIDDLTAADRVRYIAEGRYDASADSKYVFEEANAALGLDVEIKGLALSTPTYFLFAKSEGELAARVDEALKALRDNGTISALSLKWLGEDVTVDETAK